MFGFGRFWAGSGRRSPTKETRRRIRARPRSVGGEADSNAGKYRDACDAHMLSRTGILFPLSSVCVLYP